MRRFSRFLRLSWAFVGFVGPSGTAQAGVGWLKCLVFLAHTLGAAGFLSLQALWRLSVQSAERDLSVPGLTKGLEGHGLASPKSWQAPWTQSKTAAEPDCLEFPCVFQAATPLFSTSLGCLLSLPYADPEVWSNFQLWLKSEQGDPPPPPEGPGLFLSTSLYRQLGGASARHVQVWALIPEEMRSPGGPETFQIQLPVLGEVSLSSELPLGWVLPTSLPETVLAQQGSRVRGPTDRWPPVRGGVRWASRDSSEGQSAPHAEPTLAAALEARVQHLRFWKWGTLGIGMGLFLLFLLHGFFQVATGLKMRQREIERLCYIGLASSSAKRLLCIPVLGQALLGALAGALLYRFASVGCISGLQASLVLPEAVLRRTLWGKTTWQLGILFCLIEWGLLWIAVGLWVPAPRRRP